MKRTKNTLKTYFQTGDIPEQWQYENLIDSFWHLDDTLPNANLDGPVAFTNQANNFIAEQGFTNIIVGGEATFDEQTTFNAPVEFTDGLLVEGQAEFLHGLTSHEGLAIQFPLTPLDVANQSVGSILIENNSNGAEAPAIAGKSNNNSPGLQFIASTRDASGTLADMIFNIRENDNTDFTAELDSVGFQFRRLSTPLLNIHRNGRIEGLFGADFNGTLTVSDTISTTGGLTIDQPDPNTRLRFVRSGHVDYGLSLLDGKGLTITNLSSGVKEMQFTAAGQVDYNAEIVANNGMEVNNTITTPTDTHLFLAPNGNGSVFIGNTTDGSALQVRSRLNDGHYTLLTHSGTHTQINTTHDAGFHFNQDIEIEGDIRPTGTYKSSDNSPGFTGTFSTSTHNITVKDGIITDAALI